MAKLAKSISNIMPPDIQQYPVWEFIYDDEKSYPDESWARPVRKIPVDSFDGRIIGIQVCLANGQHRWAIIGNIDLENERRNRQFITLNIYDHAEWFMLARYFDVDYSQSGPQQLADFLGLPIDEVFPIHYDYSHLVSCSDCCSKGKVQKEPAEQLTDEQRLKMILGH